MGEEGVEAFELGGKVHQKFREQRTLASGMLASWKANGLKCLPQCMFCANSARAVPSVPINWNRRGSFKNKAMCS
jgi:hypothetical protein